MLMNSEVISSSKAEIHSKRAEVWCSLEGAGNGHVRVDLAPRTSYRRPDPESASARASGHHQPETAGPTIRRAAFIPISLYPDTHSEHDSVTLWHLGELSYCCIYIDLSSTRTNAKHSTSLYQHRQCRHVPSYRPSRTPLN